MKGQGCPKCGKGKFDGLCNACIRTVSDEELVTRCSRADDPDYIAGRLAFFLAKKAEVEKLEQSASMATKRRHARQIAMAQITRKRDARKAGTQ